MNAVWKRLFYLLFSFISVAFGQNAWIGWLGPIAAVAGYALFWRAVLDYASPRQRFTFGLLWFATVQALQLSWMATTDYMGPLILVVYAGLVFALGVQFGLLTWLIDSLKSLSILRCTALSGMWVLLEWARLHLCTGFSWNPAGLALTTSPLSLQMASLFGIFGLSFWVVFVNLMGLRASFLRTAPSIAAWIFCALFPYLYGAIQVSMVSFKNHKLSTLLVQTNLLPEQRDFDSQYPGQHIDPFDQWDRIISMIENANAPRIDLIVLPEGAVPYEAFHCVYPIFEVQRIWTKHYGSAAQKELPPVDQQMGKPLSKLAQYEGHTYWEVCNAFWVQALANHYQCEVIVGMDDRDFESKSHFNAAFHFSPHGDNASRIEKRVLVPVGEYVPLKNWRWFSQFVSDQFGIGESFEPGRKAKVFSGRVPMGVSICYEETFSELIRHLRIKNAQMFVNISNDVWFPGSRLAKQHFDHGMVRAVENGLPLVRACNTGITCGVDCLGGIVALHPENQAGVLFLEVPLQTFPTLYSILGDWSVLALSTLFALNLLKNRRGTCPK